VAHFSALFQKLCSAGGANREAAPKDVWKGRLILPLLGLVAVVGGLALPRLWNNPGLDKDLVSEATRASDKHTVGETQSTSSKESATEKNSSSGEELAYSPPPRPEIPDLGALLGRLVVGTVLVLALCVGTLWMGKRWLRVGAAAKTGGGQLQVLEALPLGRRCVLYLIKANQQQIVAGIDHTGLKALLPLSESFETALSEAQPDAAPIIHKFGDMSQ
jgi:flagellar biogenesis protein FliO